MAGNASGRVAGNVGHAAHQEATAAVRVNDMIQRISTVTPLSDYRLSVCFDDGKCVIYDVKEDMHLPGYGALREVYGLFGQVQLDKSRTCVFWNEDIDLPSDVIYQYGRNALD